MNRRLFSAFTRPVFASLVAAFVLVFCFAAFASEASAGCTINGQLTNRYGQYPLYIANQTLALSDGNTAVYAQTNSFGYYTFSNLQNNTTYGLTFVSSPPTNWRRWHVDQFGGLNSDLATIQCQNNASFTVNWQDWRSVTVSGNLIDDDTLNGIANRQIAVYNHATNTLIGWRLTDSNGGFDFTFECDGTEYDFDGIEFLGNNILTTHYTSAYTSIDCADADNNLFLGFIAFD